MSPTLGVSAIVIDKDNSNTIYIGTGDRDTSDAPGKGVMKSTDGGNTFSSLNTGMGDVKVGELKQHPVTGSNMIAATSGGLYVTFNGGASWTQKFSGYWVDCVYKPGDPMTAYATTNSGFYARTTDGGATWSLISTGLPATGGSRRLFLTVSPNQPTWVYALSTNGTSFNGLYRSTDSGATFSAQSTTPNIFDYAVDGSGTGGQGFYCMDVVADPNNANVLYAGSINVWKSTDAGVTWSCKTFWAGNTANQVAMHADIHQFRISPADNNFYSCNDAGLFKSTDGGTTYTNISGNLSIAQIYRLGQSKTNVNKVITGFQDNGTGIYESGAWRTEIGGDGMECAYDPADEMFLYGTYAQGQLYRSSNGGNDFPLIKNNITETGPWVTPYVIDQSNANKIFAGYKNVWRTTNAKTPVPGNVSWTSIGPNANANGVDIAHSEANNDLLYYSTSDKKMYRTDNANAGSPSWITLSLPANAIVADIAPHPTDENIVFIAHNKKVYRSADKGVNWTDISGDLPDITIHAITMDKNANEGLYVGMDVGVYCKFVTETTWTNYTHNLPLTQVRELEIFYDAGNPANNRLRGATYGRGLWSIPLATHGCMITAISVSNVSACNDQGTPNPADDTFTANVTVTYDGPPGSGTLNLTGDGSASVAVGGLNTPTSHTFNGVTMSADGGPINLVATFSANAGCTFTNANAGPAPAPCSTGPCSINTISVGNVSACSMGLFSADVTVTFFNPPGSGTLDLTGDGTASVAVSALVDTTHTFMNVMMAADGSPISLTATFSASPACTLTNANAGTAPANCMCDIMIVSVTPVDESCPGAMDGSITINATASNTLEYSINGGASYQASNVFNGLSAGSYNVIVREVVNHACNASQMTTVGQGGDTQDPVITCPPDFTALPCINTLPTAASTPQEFMNQGGTLMDNCTAINNLDVFSFDFDNGGSGCPGDPYVLIRVYEITDEAGNFAECEQEFDYVPAAVPTIDCPPDATVTCESDITIDINDAVVFVDCFFGYDLYLDGPFIDGQAGCPGATYTYEYTLIDECDQTVTCSTVFTIENPGPTIVCPGDMIVQCEADMVVDAGDAITTTQCGLGAVTWVDQPHITGARDCDGTTYEYTYHVVDDCGATASCIQTFTLSNAPPTISVPAGITVECAADIVTAASDATVTTSCGEVLDVTIYAPVISGTPDCQGTTYTYTYRVEDQCEREATADRVFTIQNIAPLVQAPADVTCDCLAGVNTNGANALVDVACNLGYDVVGAITGNNGLQDCPGTTYDVTYTATDDCGRIGSDDQKYTLQNGPPIFLNAPTVPLQLNCEDEGWEYILQAWLASVSSTTSCGTPLTVLNNYNPNAQGLCISNGTTTVTWRATDICGRQSTATGMIILADTEPPVFMEEAQDELDICNYNTPQEFLAWVAAHGNAQALDRCWDNNLNWSTIPNNPSINCIGQMGSTSVTVTFVARDGCGNKASSTGTFTALMTGGDLVEDGDGPASELTELGFALYQNRPNPFKNETLISFNLPEASSASLTIYDLSGKTLKVIEGDYSAGYNEMTINRSDLPAAGMMYYKLSSDKNTAIQRMILLD